MKILYAAANNHNAKIQLSRFLTAIQDTKHTIKIAAYKASSPRNQSIDWTLDCLLNLYRPELINLDNDNLQIYFQQVKYYAPDLVISDLEYFTSYIAQVLNIHIWQCSSSLINFALDKHDKYHLGSFKHYAHAINRDERHRQRIINLLDNSNGNFVYSHFGDTNEPPSLQGGYQWVRPYHQVGKSTVPCRHYLVAGISSNNKPVLGFLKQYADSVAFTDFGGEKHNNVLVKDIGNQEEYYCNLKNSPLFLCQGQTSFLADAFYNDKYSLIYPDYQEPEAILNSCVSQYLGLGHIINLTDDLNEYLEQVAIPRYGANIQYLHEKVNSL